MTRRLVFAVVLSILLFASPALASLTITDRQAATTELITGPQFYSFGSGTDLVVGTSTEWAGFDLDGLEIDPVNGRLVLGRDGETAPSNTPWHEPSSSTRACEVGSAQNVRAVLFDVEGEIEAGRLRADLADIRVFDAGSGDPVRFRTGSPESTSVVVDTSAAPAAVCVYWGNPDAVSASDATVQGPVEADGGWSWRIWENVGDGLSLDLVDWSTPSATTSVDIAQAPADVCNQCANELVGFITPEVSGDYRLFLSADDVGRLELGPGQPLSTSPEPTTTTTTAPAETTTTTAPAESTSTTAVPAETTSTTTAPAETTTTTAATAETTSTTTAPAETTSTTTAPAETTTTSTTAPPAEPASVLEFDPSTLEIVIELDTATPAGQFDDPEQASAIVTLEAGMAYPIRARSKDLEFGDHLEVAWALEGETPAIVATASLIDLDGTPGTITHRRFDVVATTDRSGVPDSIQRIEASETPPNSCENCAHSIRGYVVIDEAGTYRFWVSSDDEGELLLSTSGVPSEATRVAWLTNYTGRGNYTADSSQRSEAFELEAGQVIWLEAFNRDRGGPDHLQVAWSRDDTEPPTTPVLIPADRLSENEPTEAPLPTSQLGQTEGQQTANGSFVSPVLDTSVAGSNVFGLLRLVAVGDVAVEVSFSSSPEGPWSDPTPVVADQPAPLSADGQRYVRFTGQVSASPDLDPSVTSVGIERDLVEAASTDATTTVNAAAEGDQAVLRVAGSIGGPASARIAANNDGAGFELQGPASETAGEVAFGSGSHHVVVSPLPGASTATARWSVTDDLGLTVIHDIVVVFGAP